MSDCPCGETHADIYQAHARHLEQEGRHCCLTDCPMNRGSR